MKIFIWTICGIDSETTHSGLEFELTASSVGKYRVFFIEGQIRIGYKMLKILLFHVGFGFRMEVTMGYLISDQFKTHF